MSTTFYSPPTFVTLCCYGSNGCLRLIHGDVYHVLSILSLVVLLLDAGCVDQISQNGRPGSATAVLRDDAATLWAPHHCNLWQDAFFYKSGLFIIRQDINIIGSGFCWLVAINCANLSILIAKANLIKLLG